VGDTCILLPGAQGSGKSSLTAALSHRGYRYFTDEVALIERDTLEVPPMPLSLCVKSTGWDLMARYYPGVATVPTHRRMDSKIVRYLPPPSGAAHGASRPVSHIIFPRYAADAETDLQLLARTEALRRLMEECLAISQRLTKENVFQLVKWLAHIDCYALTFSSLDQAVSRIEQLVGSPANLQEAS
jgi:hypothetical protein